MAVVRDGCGPQRAHIGQHLFQAGWHLSELALLLHKRLCLSVWA